MSYDGRVYYLIFNWWLRPSSLFNKINIITYDNFCVTKIKYIIHTVQDWGVISNTSARVLLYEHLVKLLTRGKHLHDRIIIRRVKVWSHKASWTPSRFIKVHLSIKGKWAVIHIYLARKVSGHTYLPSKESERSYIST